MSFKLEFCQDETLSLFNWREFQNSLLQNWILFELKQQNIYQLFDVFLDIAVLYFK